jgi:hypothetical protein
MKTALDSILTRAIALITAETQALRGEQPLAQVAFAERKNMIYFELARIEGAIAGSHLDAAAIAKFKRLRALLAENRDLLEVHLAAAKDIAALFSELIRSAESDGTYSVPLATRRRMS